MIEIAFFLCFLFLFLMRHRHEETARNRRPCLTIVKCTRPQIYIEARQTSKDAYLFLYFLAHTCRSQENNNRTLGRQQEPSRARFPLFKKKRATISFYEDSLLGLLLLSAFVFTSRLRCPRCHVLPSASSEKQHHHKTRYPLFSAAVMNL